ncbi:potassium transporter TrkA [Haloarcula sp. CBA1130]|nr:potassium transporter TrkA [Haloarcula sp. CBA1130]KAA9397549.1 potassium transporter TrkA [Haloarcula sp. CBA1129]
MIPLRAGRTDSSNETEEASHYILGGGQVGTAIAQQLLAAGQQVTIVDNSYESSDIPGFTGDPATIDVLVEAGVETASTVIVVTRSDRRNLLIAQLVQARFDVPRVIAFVHDPARVPLFAAAGHEPFCVTTAIAETFGETI